MFLSYPVLQLPLDELDALLAPLQRKGERQDFLIALKFRANDDNKNAKGEGNDEENWSYTRERNISQSD